MTSNGLRGTPTDRRKMIGNERKSTPIGRQKTKQQALRGTDRKKTEESARRWPCFTNCGCPVPSVKNNEIFSSIGESSGSLAVSKMGVYMPGETREDPFGCTQ